LFSIAYHGIGHVIEEAELHTNLEG
jgi:hypothetical protein